MLTNDELKEAIDKGFDRVFARFDALDARVRDNESEISVLQYRADNEKKTASKWGSVFGAIGGLVGGFFAGIMGGRS